MIHVIHVQTNTDIYSIIGLSEVCPNRIIFAHLINHMISALLRDKKGSLHFRNFDGILYVRENINNVIRNKNKKSYGSNVVGIVSVE